VICKSCWVMSMEYTVEEIKKIVREKRKTTKELEHECLDKLIEKFGDKVFTTEDIMEDEETKEALNRLMILRNGEKWSGKYIPHLRCRKGIHDYYINFIQLSNKRLYYIDKEITPWISVLVVMIAIILIYWLIFLIRTGGV